MKNAAKYTAGVLAAALSIATGLGVRWEGRRLTAYQDVAGVWTICDGHTKGVYPGMRATPEQCDAWLAEEMREAQRMVVECIDPPLTANQLGAFTDAAYNLGPAVVCGSTLQRLANKGDIRGACYQLADAKNSRGEPKGWTYAAGKWIRGLFLRRMDEREVCWPNFGNVVAG